MPKRTIATIIGPKGAARITRDTEWDEYIVHLVGESEDADYRTEDKADAISTATHMVGNPVSK